MSRRKLFAFVVLLALLLPVALSGCTWFGVGPGTPPLTVVTSPQEGHPREANGGLFVTFRCSGGTGKYVLAPGDGSPDITVAGNTITHTYTQAGEYTARVVSGGRSQEVQIRVINHAPIVLPAFSASRFEWMGRTILDARYREHGCHNGAPISANGVYDPDGDPIVAYEWRVTGPDKDGEIITYSVFSPSRENIAGQTTDNPVVVIFPGWTRDDPPYPFSIRAVESACPPTPPSPPNVQPSLEPITITLKAYDLWGGMGEATWTVELASVGCSNPNKNKQ